MLYEALRRLNPSPIIALNHAVAVVMASGPAAGLELVDATAARGDLGGSHLLSAIRGEMLARMGHRDEARTEYLHAASLCDNAAERAVLEQKAAR